MNNSPEALEKFFTSKDGQYHCPFLLPSCLDHEPGARELGQLSREGEKNEE